MAKNDIPAQDGMTDDEINQAALLNASETDNPFVELGDTGLLRYDGVISEEWFAQAKGLRGIRLIREMSDNHPVIGSILFAIRMLMRGVEWNIEAASESPEDLAVAEFAEQCLSDMNMSWQDTLTELMSFIEMGWSMGEIVFKVRQGPDEEDDALRSAYSDKKIGIRKIAIRSQDSLFKFEMNDAGDVVGMWQQPPLGGKMLYIPRERMLHLRASTFKNNPLGRSALRNCMVPYLIQKKLQEIEAIGVERDLAGYPVFYAPGEIMKRDATPDQKAMLRKLTSALRNIRRDSSEGLILPSDTDSKTGKPLYDFKLLTSGGARQLQPDPIIQRYDQRIAMTVLADFVMIGNSGAGGGRGSYGMAQAKQSMFATALSAWLDAVCEEFNRQVLPQLMRMNNIPMASCPKLAHGEVESPNLQQLGAYISALSGAGAPLFPDSNLEKWLRDVSGMPDPAGDQAQVSSGNAASNIKDVGAVADNQHPVPKPGATASTSEGSGASMAEQSPGAIQ